jgi:hypothetical protein
MPLSSDGNPNTWSGSVGLDARSTRHENPSEDLPRTLRGSFVPRARFGRGSRTRHDSGPGILNQYERRSSSTTGFGGRGLSNVRGITDSGLTIR